MTRKKKTRKPAMGSVGASKADKKQPIEKFDKKPKKRVGNKPGSRQTIATAKNKGDNKSTAAKDPRLGSKKPIVLVKTAESTKPQAKSQASAIKTIAPIKVLAAENSLEQELYAIEQDERLQAILQKQDQELPLTNEEVDLFNQLMDRHQEITEQLGWQDDEDQEKASNKALSDDDLWDKLDTTDFSDYE